VHSLTRSIRRLGSNASEAPRKKPGASASRSESALSNSLKGVPGSRVKSKPLRVPLIAIFPCTDCFSSLPRLLPSSEVTLSEVSSVPIRPPFHYWQQGSMNSLIHALAWYIQTHRNTIQYKPSR